MTSRPATPESAVPSIRAEFDKQLERKLEQPAPESETPETDAVVHNGFSLARVARSLERRLAQSQARVAELEKDAARYRFLAEQHNDWHVERWIDTMRSSGTWQSIRGTALGNAIDAALKDRA